jgi:hypothetical protein
MTPEMTGALIGAGVGLLSYFAISIAAANIEKGNPTAEQVRRASLLRFIGRVDVLVLAVVGYFVGPLVLT